MRHLKDSIDKEMNKIISSNKLNKYPGILHAISNVSLHKKLDGSQYVGWLLNKAQSKKKETIYFEDCYGGHWKLQKLKSKHENT